MSHLDHPFADPDHARTPAMPSLSITAQSITDRFREEAQRFVKPSYTTWESRDNPLPPELDAKMAGFEDAAHMLISEEEWAALKQGSSNAEHAVWQIGDSWWALYAPKAVWAGPPDELPEVLRAPPVVPDRFTQAGHQFLYLEGSAQWWFQVGSAWAKTQDPDHYSCKAFSLPAHVFAMEMADPPRLQDDAVEREHLYMLAFLRGAIAGRKLYKELAEQIARGGASAGRTSKFDQGA